MNFPAHAWVSHAAGVHDPEELLGTMIPDLAELAAVKFDVESLSPAVALGRSLHHAADTAFHDHAAFRAGVGGLRRELHDAGLAAGPRRAAAHVGYELLLDATLDWSPDAAGSFDRALHAGASLVPAGGEAARARWSGVMARLRAADVPNRRASIDELAARIAAILSRRPRLALADRDEPVVAIALTRAEPGVRASASVVLADLTDWLRERR